VRLAPRQLSSSLRCGDGAASTLNGPCSPHTSHDGHRETAAAARIEETRRGLELGKALVASAMTLLSVPPLAIGASLPVVACPPPQLEPGISAPSPPIPSRSNGPEREVAILGGRQLYQVVSRPRGFPPSSQSSVSLRFLLARAEPSLAGDGSHRVVA
jgi:hypothetical protein